MKLNITKPEDRILKLDVQFGHIDGEPVVWRVTMKMLTRGQRAAWTQSQLTAEFAERAEMLFQTVCNQLVDVECDLFADGLCYNGQPIDWSDKAVVKEVLSSEDVFGMSFVFQLWEAYEKELDARLGKLKSP